MDETAATITDHRKDLIIVSGFNVFPREVEVLYQHPQGKGGTAVGLPDAYAGSGSLFVVLKEGETATEDEIIAFCRERLTRYKVPSAVGSAPNLPVDDRQDPRRALRDEQQPTIVTVG
jgi:long-chain acyl-CoA synthetase